MLNNKLPHIEFKESSILSYLKNHAYHRKFNVLISRISNIVPSLCTFVYIFI